MIPVMPDFLKKKSMTILFFAKKKQQLHFSITASRTHFAATLGQVAWSVSKRNGNGRLYRKFVDSENTGRTRMINASRSLSSRWHRRWHKFSGSPGQRGINSNDDRPWGEVIRESCRWLLSILIFFYEIQKFAELSAQISQIKNITIHHQLRKVISNRHSLISISDHFLSTIGQRDESLPSPNKK